MVAFHSPDHLNPREKKAFGGTQDYLENCFTIPLIFCSFTTGIKHSVLSPVVARACSLVEEPAGATREGPVQCMATSNRVLWSPAGTLGLQVLRSHMAGPGPFSPLSHFLISSNQRSTRLCPIPSGTTRSYDRLSE